MDIESGSRKTKRGRERARKQADQAEEASAARHVGMKLESPAFRSWVHQLESYESLDNLLIF